MIDKPAAGKALGGHARAESLTPSRRRQIAKKAAAARWKDPVLRATHGAADHPLRIGVIEIPCYVLENQQRVLSSGGMIRALGMKAGGAAGRQGDRVYQFATGINIRPFLSNDLLNRMENPVRFQAPTGGSIATGYEATILTDLCDAVMAAREAGALRADQLHIARQCEILVRGLARVGIIALIDEATGYQRDRTSDALARILEAFIAKELRPWIQTFPPDYYEQLFRLRELEYNVESVKRPQYFGVLTNDIVYKRIAPGVLEELKRIAPKGKTGRYKNRFFQWLTANIGYPKLREHLGSVVAIMKLSTNWHDFVAKLDRLHPRFGPPHQLTFDYEGETDEGRGL